MDGVQREPVMKWRCLQTLLFEFIIIICYVPLFLFSQLSRNQPNGIEKSQIMTIKKHESLGGVVLMKKINKTIVLRRVTTYKYPSVSSLDPLYVGPYFFRVLVGRVFFLYQY